MRRRDVAARWLDALAGLRATALAAGLEQSGPVGGVCDDDLFTRDADHARAYLPVRDSPALDGIDARWELPAARFAVALHVGPARTATSTAATPPSAPTPPRTAATAGERYLTGPFDTADDALWRTEVCWPMVPVGAEGN